ncbi:putative NAC domain-containing protein SOG1 [Helianthus annuus]|nr:putative NAC domain-containing protein SOG1 [Helianthus annuus]KAJ0461798.1 putative NAC domain-containing protein SOG1 [Helianthus annuus]KAJ0642184.1 putative NAC domain-containing protein SOG1 [Helianthus annuus]
MNISSSGLIDAKLEEHQLCGSKHCPGCGHRLEGKPVPIMKRDGYLQNISDLTIRQNHRNHLHTTCFQSA